MATLAEVKNELLDRIRAEHEPVSVLTLANAYAALVQAEWGEQQVEKED